ncbi:MAG TPA: hypothetical protein ENN67_03890 [Firmicutes bacterium]|nr:hypothetical protein [Bacillota bacterium]
MTSEEKVPDREETGEVERLKTRPDFNRFVAIDLETTGLIAKEHEIIEIGAVRYVDGAETEFFHALVKPSMGYPERNRRLTGIPVEQLESGVDIKTALAELIEFIGGDLLISHNANFDLSFLEHQAQRFGLEPIMNPALCTLHLAALVDPEADVLQLGSLAKLWRIEIVESHRAVLDARLAGKLAIKFMDEIRSWRKEFISHLTQYRGKSVDAIFDLLDSLVDESVADKSWNIGKAIGERLTDESNPGSIVPFPDYGNEWSADQNPDPEMIEETKEAFSRGGITILEDIRPGKPASSSCIPIGTEGIPRLVVAVPDEMRRRRAVGEDGGTDGLGKSDGTVYLGRLSEYICMWRSFGKDNRPHGWLELSPFERIVLARWLAGTRTGRVGRVNWWLLNNFSGLKGHLNSLSESRHGCLGFDYPHNGPCYAKIALNAASKAGRVVVDHAHVFSEYKQGTASERLIEKIPAIFIECADQLEDGARNARGRLLEMEPIVRRLSSFVENADGEDESVINGVKLALSSLKEILESSRETLTAIRSSVETEHSGPMSIDDETWSDERFSELAASLEAGGDMLAMSVEKIRGAEKINDESMLIADVIGQASETLRMFRHIPRGWSASLEGVPFRSPRRVSIKLIPVEVGELVSKLVKEAESGLVATGRHLRYGGSFERIKSQWGLDTFSPVIEKVLEDPSVMPPPLFLPEDLTPPSGRSGRKYHWQKYLERTANLLKMLAESLGGRTVAVFSAHHELRKVRELLEESSPAGPIVLAQYHDGTKNAIINEYVQNQATLLLGGRNFLDGVDLRPAGFTVLVIVKIPFTSPEEPLHKTALKLAEDVGLDGLTSHLVPEAVKATNRWIDSLVAGAIQDGFPSEDLPGAVVLLDPRAVYNEWGDEYLDSLNAKPVHRLSFRVMLINLKELGKQADAKQRD